MALIQADQLYIPPLTKVLQTHDILLQQYGGRSGINNIGLIESALQRPTHKILYATPETTMDLADLAATLCYGLAKNHGFVDGNKRTALVTTIMFLIRSNVEPERRHQPVQINFQYNADVVTLMERVVAGATSEAELAQHIRDGLVIELEY